MSNRILVIFSGFLSALGLSSAAYALDPLTKLEKGKTIVPKPAPIVRISDAATNDWI